MTLEDQIDQLERERTAELRNVGWLFSRAKRDVRRSVSPDRFLRRNIGLGLAVAAAAGMFAAPAPSYIKKDAAERKARKAGTRAARLPFLLRMVARAVPQLQPWLKYFDKPAPAKEREEAPDEVKAPASKQAKQGLLGLAMAQVLSTVIKRVDWGRVMGQVMGQATGGGAGHGNGNGNGGASEPPTVAVADVGTTRGDEPFGNRMAG